MQCYATLTSVQSKFLHIKKAFSLSAGNHAVKNSPNGKKHTFILIGVLLSLC